MIGDAEKTDGKEQTGSGRKRVIDFFLKPPIWFDVVVWAVTAVLIGLAVSAACLDSRAEIWAFSLYAAALLSVVASLYVILTFGDFPQRVARNKKVKRFIADFGYRSYVTSVCSALLNVMYAAFGTVIAAVTHSVWLGALVWYHIVLTKLKAYTLSGVALIVMAIAVVPVILLVVWQRNSYVFFGGTLVYVCALALYTVIKVTVSVVGRKKARRSEDFALKAIKNIAFADALISVFALQATMLVALEDAALAATINPSIGGVIAFFIALTGITMIIGGVKKIRRGDFVGAGGEANTVGADGRADTDGGVADEQ